MEEEIRNEIEEEIELEEETEKKTTKMQKFVNGAAVVWNKSKKFVIGGALLLVGAAAGIGFDELILNRKSGDDQDLLSDGSDQGYLPDSCGGDSDSGIECDDEETDEMEEANEVEEA